MKIHSEHLFFTALFCAVSLTAQERPATPQAPSSSDLLSTSTNAPGDYASDVAVVRDAQKQMLDQAKQMLDRVDEPTARQALEAAIKQMEQSAALLEQAGRSPEKLSAALAAEQAAYQALMKLIPREYRVSRSRNGGQGNAGQPNRRQLDQLEMTDEENRYETERQATPDRQQNEQSKIADRLKQLARRQQDLNERLRELQAALPEARTDQQREEIERQLKRLRDEERQMLSDMDELRQDVARSPNNSSSTETRQRLDQTRSEMQRAAQELEQQGVSQALAAGTRAQQSLQNLKEDLRRQTSSRFSEQMRQLRSQARDLARQEDEIGRDLQSLAGADHKSLDDSSERQQLFRQMSRQQDGLTNVLAGMRAATEQAENTEPLVSRQLYDLLRRADQMRTDNLLETSAQLVDRGFLPQAAEAEQSARRNLHELRQGIERAAEQVLGNETEALRYAQKELDDLTRQMGRELTGLETNSANRAVQPAAGDDPGTNVANGTSPRPGGREGQPAGRDSQPNQPGSGEAASAGNEAQPGSTPGQPNGENRPDANGGDNTASANEPGQGADGSATGNNSRATSPNGNEIRNGSAGRNRLRELVQQIGDGGDGGALTSGPIMGNSFVDWSDRMRDVEEVLDAPDLRNRLAAVRERVAGLRAEYRQRGRIPEPGIVRTDILTPMAQVRVWLQEELARRENASSLVPLDRDPVPEKYSESVRHYYEKLGSAQ